MKGKKFTCLSLLASLLLVFAAGFAGVAFADDDDDGDTGLGALDDVSLNPTLRPFSLVEIVPAVREDGEVDYFETELKAYDVAFAIARYVAITDETEEFDDFVETNWILAGFEGDPDEMTDEEIDEAVAAAILGIPTNHPVVPGENPEDPETAKKTVNLFEICNTTFASKALGVDPIVEESEGGPAIYIENGYIHAPALPCEIAVYSDDKRDRIRVEMLNAEAIFTLFFTDVLFGDQMEDEDFAEAVYALPEQVNREIQSIIYAAVEDKGTQVKESKSAGLLNRKINDKAEQSEAKAHHGSKTKGKRVTRVRPLGPKYESLLDVEAVVENTEYQSPYVHFVYDKENGEDQLGFSSEEAKAVAQAMIEVLKGDKTDLPLNFLDWKAPRPAPLSVPGQNYLVEACSPENAKAAMDMGMYHATALPCAVTTRAQDYDEDGNVELFVTYLNPHFMFDAMFSDADSGMTEEQLYQHAANLLADLQIMMEAAIDVFDDAHEDFEVGDGLRVPFDMLPHLDEEDE